MNLVVAHSHLHWCAIPAAAVPVTIPAGGCDGRGGGGGIGLSGPASGTVIPVKSNNMHRYMSMSSNY